jgi:hypothetical protein
VVGARRPRGCLVRRRPELWRGQQQREGAREGVGGPGRLARCHDDGRCARRRAGHFVARSGHHPPDAQPAAALRHGQQEDGRGLGGGGRSAGQHPRGGQGRLRRPQPVERGGRHTAQRRSAVLAERRCCRHPDALVCGVRKEPARGRQAADRGAGGLS